jgi:hypothetical protein
MIFIACNSEKSLTRNVIDNDSEIITTTDEDLIVTDSETIVLDDEVITTTDEDLIVTDSETIVLDDEIVTVSDEEVINTTDSETIVLDDEIVIVSDEETITTPDEETEYYKEITYDIIDEYQNIFHIDYEDNAYFYIIENQELNIYSYYIVNLNTNEIKKIPDLSYYIDGKKIYSPKILSENEEYIFCDGYKLDKSNYNMIMYNVNNEYPMYITKNDYLPLYVVKRIGETIYFKYNNEEFTLKNTSGISILAMDCFLTFFGDFIIDKYSYIAYNFKTKKKILINVPLNITKTTNIYYFDENNSILRVVNDENRAMFILLDNISGEFKILDDCVNYVIYNIFMFNKNNIVIRSNINNNSNIYFYDSFENIILNKYKYFVFLDSIIANSYGYRIKGNAKYLSSTNSVLRFNF